ncbi:MAG: peroxidase [Gemmatimonadetes bacterium]|uniref:Peroxidase n=1 Tax=Candidatus Kutchimonas denitrificans TaxID=3056748 RepID=A0AAE4ZBN9_9BACT|nr:peroxidase [Gemmatimonadota bacterium]NIR74575.1 peroxidase [Candidatus Kutchimonas denitrificans]NIS02765.1 peroxidase [Gemmatimonadota bacterium]NIT68926.1 peroxidase [Gemmatimonadota bacterium]NIU52231.1 peroxidase [Gemmatimonadota bacterium]
MPDSESADAFVHAVVRNWRAAPLAPGDRALCKFAAKLTRQPDKMDPGDLDDLRVHGFDDRAIHDAVQVIGYFNYITRIADGLGVEAEDFIEPWGQR